MRARRQPIIRAFCAVSALAGLACCAGLDDLTGGAPLVATDDAGRELDGATPSDARSDRDLDDHNVIDGTTSSKEDASIPCVGMTFCDDFERTLVQGTWDDATSALDASLALTTDHALTGAKSLRLQLTTNENGAWLEKSFLPSTEVRFAFAFYAQVVVGRYVQLARLTHIEGNRAVHLHVALNPDGRVAVAQQEFVAQIDKGYTEIGSSAVLPGQWTRVYVELNLASTPQRVSALQDGVRFVDNKALPLVAPATPILLDLGTNYCTAGAARQVDFDDVRFARN